MFRTSNSRASRRRVKNQLKRHRRLRSEQLERRILLAVDGLMPNVMGESVGEIFIPAPTTTVSLAGGSLAIIETGDADDRLTIRMEEDDYVLHNANQSLATMMAGVTGGDSDTIRIPAADVTRIVVNSQGGDDHLTIDFGGGDFAVPIEFNGGAQSTPSGDLLSLVGGSFDSAEYIFDNAHDGSINVSGNATIRYTGLEPISSTITATNVILNYSTTAETLTVTDVGSGQTNVTSSSAAESVNFNNPTGTLTINPGDTGPNTIDVNSLAASYPASFDINGGDGGDTVNFKGKITFAAGKSLTIDAKTIHVDTEIETSGLGTIDLGADRNIAMSSGSSLTTADGNLTMNANTAGSATGDFVGIDIDAATVQAAGAGQVLLQGQGGDDPGGDQHGIYLHNSGRVIGGSDCVEIVGTGGMTEGNDNVGILVWGAGSQITSAGGNVSVTGTGGGEGASNGNHGLWVSSAGLIEAGGMGTVTVQGNGGNTVGTGGVNHGVYLTGTAAATVSRITSGGGNVAVTGNGGGGGTGGNNYGLYMLGPSEITAGGSGTVTVEGNGGNNSVTGGENYGVWVTTGAARITSGGGNVSVTGKGGGSGISDDNHGVYLTSSGEITAGGSGTVTVEGYGGNTLGSGDSNRGVFMFIAQISSGGGNVSVTGVGGGATTSPFNDGIFVSNASEITAGGSGTVTVKGTGGNSSGTGNRNHGVHVLGTNSRISSGGGNVSVTGIGGGAGNGDSNHGVYVLQSGEITAGGSGTVTVVGNGGNTSGTGGGNRGVYVNNAGSRITSSGGNVSVTGTGGGSDTSAVNVGVWVGVSGEITAGASGLVSVVGNGGNTTGTGGTFNYGVYVVSPGSRITSGGGNVSVIGSGGGAGTAEHNYGVFAENSGEFTAGGSGTVTVVGNGGNLAGTGSANYGVLLNNSQITSAGGDVSVTGKAGGGINNVAVVLIISGAITTASDGGAIAVIGDSMSLDSGSIAAPADIVTLTQKTDGTQIDLGGADVLSGSPLTLGLTDAELDVITADAIIVGDANSGPITFSSPIDPAGTDELAVVTGGGVIRDTNTVGTDVTVDELLLDGTVSPGASAGIMTATADVTLADNASFDVEIGGPTPGVSSGFHDQLAVVGSLTIGVGVTLNTTAFDDGTGSDYAPVLGDSYLIIDNDGSDAVTGQFHGLPEGAFLSNLLGSDRTFKITYTGGDGNDVVLDDAGVKDPGFPFVDADNSGSYLAAASDVLLDNGELDDGFFDTDIPDLPSYTAAIPGAGLSIQGAPISNTNLDYSADGDLIVNTDLTATTGNLLLTSRDRYVLLDDPTLQAKNLLEITAGIDIVSEDDVLVTTGASSRIHLDAVEDVLLTGTRVEAKKDVDIDAGIFIIVKDSTMNPGTITATPNTVGKVDLDATGVSLIGAEIEARKDIVIKGAIEANGAKLTANGHGLAKIDLNGAAIVNLTDAELIARKSIEIDVTYGGFGLKADNALIDAVGGGSTTVTLTADNDVSLKGATVRAKQNVGIGSNLGLINVSDATLEANTHSAGTVSLVASGNIYADRAMVIAKRDVIFGTISYVSAEHAQIEATGPQVGKIGITAGVDISLDDAKLKAGLEIDILAVGGSITAARSQLLACGKPSSQVRIEALSAIDLEDALIRAGNLIDILAVGQVSVKSASIGIWYPGAGDISIKGSSIDRTDAVLKAPDLLTLTGALIGTAMDDSPGTLPCP